MSLAGHPRFRSQVVQQRSPRAQQAGERVSSASDARTSTVSADRKSAFPPSGFQNEYPIFSDCSTNAAHNELDSVLSHMKASESHGQSRRVARLSSNLSPAASSATSMSAPSVDFGLSTARMELRGGDNPQTQHKRTKFSQRSASV
eukprot:37149-Prorocentrum_minimum.AAC.3